MAYTHSAKKAHRQSLRRRAQNIKRKETYRGSIKKLLRFSGDKKQNEARSSLSLLYQQLDKAAKTNAISRNKARRLKSRFAKRLAALSS